MSSVAMHKRDRSRAFGSTTPGVAALARVENLIIVRQSGPGAVVLLGKMLERTLTTHNTVPGWAGIRAAGVQPLFDRERYRKWWSLPSSGRATLFQVDGTYVLLVLGSAAARDVAMSQADDPTENAVVMLYAEVLAELQPRNVLVGPFDRLVRALAYSFKTLEAFRASVAWLKCDEGVLDLGDPDAEQVWQNWTNEATAAHKRTLNRTAAGSVSMIRENRWPLASFQCPLGLARDQQGEFVIVPEEVRMIETVVRLLVHEDMEQAAVARWLVDNDALTPVRRGTAGRRKYDGIEMETSPGAPMSRANQILGRVLRLLPDMAMGKYVASRKQPASVDAVHQGARRHALSGMGYAHCFAWDLPDVLSGIDDEDLLVAVRLATEYRLRTKLAASDWLIEVEARKQTRRVIEDGPGTDGYDEAVRWAGQTGALIDSMAGGEEHSRSLQVRQVIAEVEQDTIRWTQQRGRPSRRAALFSRWPVSIGPDGQEWMISTVMHGYTLLSRPVDESRSAMASLARPWNPRQRKGAENIVRGRFRKMDFHRALARAAAEAIEAGVPVLRGQRKAAGQMGAVGVAEDTRYATERLRLEQEVAEAADRSRIASEETLRLQQKRSALRSMAEEDSIAGTGSDSSRTSSLDARLAHYEEREEDAWDAELRAKEALAVFDEADSVLPVLTAVPTVDDFDVTLRTLVKIASTESADPRVARSVQGLVHRLDFTHVDAFGVEFSFDLLVPEADGKKARKVGPIFGWVPTAAQQPIGHVSWGHAYAAELCLRRLRVEHSMSSRLGDFRIDHGDVTPGEQASILAGRYLKSKGLTLAQSTAVLHSRVQSVRAIVWNAVHGLPQNLASLGVSRQFVEVVLAAYLDGPMHMRSQSVFERQALLHAIVDAGSLLTKDLLVLSNKGPSTNPKARALLVRNSLSRLPPRYDAFVGTRLVQAGRDATGFTKEWFPLPCPHCAVARAAAPDPENIKIAYIDLLAWEPEVPGGTLCSTCMRNPRDPNTVYPDVYKTLNSASAAGRASGEDT